MAWKPIAERLATLPVVLAGPILRRVEKDNVSVWLALKEARTGANKLVLEIYDNGTTSTAGTTAILRGSRDTVALGEHLHVVVLTAKLNGHGSLQQGHTYSYNVTGTGVDLRGNTDVCYLGYALPTFALPPADLNELRIIHASCRKMHSDGTDALADIDGVIGEMTLNEATLHTTRPHQLFLTGDQIYADDVDALLLFLIRDLSEGADAALDIDASPPRQPGTRVSLMNWQERLPIGALPATDYLDTDSRYAGRLEVGRRGELLKEEYGIHFPGEWEVADNHLIKLGEYYAMYLLMWSPILWPADTDYPEFRNVYSHRYFPAAPDTTHTLYGTPEQIAQLPAKDPLEKEPYQLLQRSIIRAKLYQEELIHARRAMANVPTYMICDDHEITDDWFLDYHWCETALTQNLGRRIMQNGLTAYTLFQSWGNNPQQFEQNPGINYSGLGWRFLNTVPLWSSSALAYSVPDPNGTLLDNGVPTVHNLWESLGIMTGLPNRYDLLTHRQLKPQNVGRIQHHFYIAWEKHEVLVLDTRTMRAYPGYDSDYAALISDEGLGIQMAELAAVRPANSTIPVPEITFLVIATPISGIPNVEDTLTGSTLRYTVFKRALKKGEDTENDINYFLDSEGYGYQQRGLQALYAGICKCVAARQQYNPNAAPGRIIVLSGDVHYGFTNRVEFWAKRFFDMDVTATGNFDTHFILVQLCASALKNSKDDFLDLIIYSKGKGTYGNKSVDALGYDSEYLLNPSVWSGWIFPDSGILTLKVGEGFVPSSILPVKYYYISYYSPVIETSAILPLEPQLAVPDWIYRINYIKATPPTLSPPRERVDDPNTSTTTPTAQQRAEAFQNISAAIRNNRQYLEEDSAGSEAVGRNNFGEVIFEWGTTETTKFVRHNIWWSRPKRDGTDDRRLPLSKFVVLLGQDSNQYPEPVYPYTQ